MQQELILSLCKELRLGAGISERYGQIQAETHEDFLVKLLTETVQNRAVERKNRYIKQAHFDLIKEFGNYDFSDLILPQGVTKESLQTCLFVKNKQNLIHYGRPGTGNYAKYLLM